LSQLYLKSEKQALEKQLAEKETPIIHQDQEKIEQLTQERQKFLQERNQLQMLSKRLKSDLSNSEHQLRKYRTYCMKAEITQNRRIYGGFWL
jgi:shikimate kinase